MAIPDKALIKQCLGSPFRMRTLQEKKKLTIYASDFFHALNFTGALAVKEFVERNSEFLEKDVFHVDGLTTTVEYRPGKGKAKPRVVVFLTNCLS
ncbi:MAG TPA: hypothetical protein DCE56_02265 [Cyanobacteria bacterium UBA8553]|nr:hypothetical protein [Cyanobacteria bacterium UBA8553]